MVRENLEGVRAVANLTERMQLMISPQLIGKIDAWRSVQAGLPGRSLAVRSLVVKGLEAYRKEAEGRDDGGVVGVTLNPTIE